MTQKYDYVIIGGGIVGLTVALFLKETRPAAKIVLLEKEEEVASHASGRNSGVLHAGFYYTADSLKARFTVEGNRTMKEYCRRKNIPINECGKLVVATDAAELELLHELERRGKRNGSDVSLISEKEAEAIEPNVRTYQKALYSPLTASIDPKEVCLSLKNDCLKAGIELVFKACYCGRKDNTILTTKGDFTAERVVNCAGLYADKIAHDFGFGLKYTMMPFKGIYLKYTKNKTDIKTNIYPVPNLKNPFLGVHYTKTVKGDIKIGPTAIPAFWRENYTSFENFHPRETLEVLFYQSRLFMTNSFKFRELAVDEMRKYNKKYFINLATKLVKSIDPDGFTEFTKPGIRAQLLNKSTLSLVQDFIVEGDKNSTHILNAVSPAFTCAFPFARYVTQNHILA